MVKLIAFLSLIAVTATAHAKNQEIHDFHFSTCNGSRCIELWSPTGLMSQLQFAFTTQGSTRVHLFDQASKFEKTYEGIESSYMPNLNCITLSQSNGGSLVISLDDFKVETFGGAKR